MKMRVPILWLALIAMWLLLSTPITLGQAVLALLAATAAVTGLRALQRPRAAPPRLLPALRLAGVIAVDVARSNLAVASIVLWPKGRKHPAGFVAIPLQLRDPLGLAMLASIITAAPGTSWAGYDSRAGVLTMHVLELDDSKTWIAFIKNHYERPLLEIFE
jgi:multicomponent K+:H+ antiporter subunit E